MSPRLPLGILLTLHCPAVYPSMNTSLGRLIPHFKDGKQVVLG